MGGREAGFLETFLRPGRGTLWNRWIPKGFWEEEVSCGTFREASQTSEAPTVFPQTHSEASGMVTQL